MAESRYTIISSLRTSAFSELFGESFSESPHESTPDCICDSHLWRILMSHLIAAARPWGILDDVFFSPLISALPSRNCPPILARPCSSLHYLVCLLTYLQRRTIENSASSLKPTPEEWSLAVERLKGKDASGSGAFRILISCTNAHDKTIYRALGNRMHIPTVEVPWRGGFMYSRKLLTRGFIFFDSLGSLIPTGLIIFLFASASSAIWGFS